MTDRPIDGIFDTDAALTVLGKRAALEQLLQNVKEHLGGAPATEITISGGSLTGAQAPSSAVHTVDTEGDAATDDLDNMSVANHPDGRMLLLSAESAARTVVMKTGGASPGDLVLLYGDAEFSLNNVDQYSLFQRRGTSWVELLRSGTEDKHIVGGAGEPAYGTGWGSGVFSVFVNSPSVRFYKTAGGEVRLHGIARLTGAGSAGPADGSVFTLPAAYVPDTDRWFGSASVRHESTTSPLFTIQTDSVFIGGASGVLDGQVFLHDVNSHGILPAGDFYYVAFDSISFQISDT